MNDVHASDRHLMKTGARFFGHTLAVVLGLALMLVGLGMGVTMVMLPIGLPLGLAGVLLVVWGLWFSTPRKQT
jgi:cytochrome c biogenesis protein CcdA